MAERVGDVPEKLEFQQPVPHFDAGNAQRPLAKQLGLRVKHVEIAADGDALADPCAVIQFQHRQQSERRNGGHAFGKVFAGNDVQFGGRNGREALFGDTNTRTRRGFGALRDSNSLIACPLALVYAALRRRLSGRQVTGSAVQRSNPACEPQL